MKKNYSIVVSLLLISASQIIATSRDPFACMTQKTTVSESKKTVLPVEKSKKQEAPAEQWKVQEMRKNAVVLQDIHGNIREISFSDTKKN